jgi:hypothetical protein
MSDKPHTLFVAAASYETVDDALADYEAVKALCAEITTSHGFAAAVIGQGPRWQGRDCQEARGADPARSRPRSRLRGWRPVLWPRFVQPSGSSAR